MLYQVDLTINSRSEDFHQGQTNFTLLVHLIWSIILSIYLREERCHCNPLWSGSYKLDNPDVREVTILDICGLFYLVFTSEKKAATVILCGSYKLDNPDVRVVTILDICGPPTLLSTKALK